jgi:hypothetical protein
MKVRKIPLSVMMPTSLSSRITGRQPILLSSIKCASSSMGVSSVVVMTSLTNTGWRKKRKRRPGPIDKFWIP